MILKDISEKQQSNKVHLIAPPPHWTSISSAPSLSRGCLPTFQSVFQRLASQLLHCMHAGMAGVICVLGSSCEDRNFFILSGHDFLLISALSVIWYSQCAVFLLGLESLHLHCIMQTVGPRWTWSHHVSFIVCLPHTLLNVQEGLERARETEQIRRPDSCTLLINNWWHRERDHSQRLREIKRQRVRWHESCLVNCSVWVLLYSPRPHVPLWVKLYSVPG